MEQIRRVRYDDDGHGRKLEVVVKIDDPTQYDQEEFSAIGLNIDLSNRVRIYVQYNDRDRTECAKTFMERDTFERLGVDYIVAHAELHTSSVVGYVVHISQNDYWNDMARYPETIVPVTFIGTEDGTGRELYRSAAGRGKVIYYAREVYYPRENCAKWFCYGARNSGDGWRPSANTIFDNHGHREKVRYDDWNGVMAYSDTFNVKFNQFSGG